MADRINITVSAEGIYKDRGSKFLAFAEPICDEESAKKAAKVRKAVRKNCKLMKQTLTKEQYSKYLSVINATISNKGLDEMINE